MSDYAFVADRARSIFSTVARLEKDFLRSPDSVSIRVNLTSARRAAEKARKELDRLAQINSIEVCNYRLVPRRAENYALGAVSKSFLSYQNLFSQIYDRFKSGRKIRAVIGNEALAESQLEFGYSFSGSLGVVLLAQSEKDLFTARLDQPIEALYQVLSVSTSDEVRDVAREMGNAVVKRMHDWSQANAEGGYATDVKWSRSDGRQFGQFVEQDRMGEIVELIDAASEQREKIASLNGTLVGIDTQARTFHFVTTGSVSIKGRLDKDFGSDGEIVVPKRYKSKLLESKQYKYALEKTETKHVLLYLSNLD